MVARHAEAAGSFLSALLACIAVLAACSSSRSTGGGVGIDRFEPEVRVQAELRDESYGNVATKETIFRENFKTDLEGNIYHPRLMTFGGVLDLGLEQRETDQRGAPSSIRSNHDNNHYDLAATLLKDHPYSARLFAQRSQVRIRQSFFPTSNAVVTRNGALLMAKEWPVPSQLELASYDFEGESGELNREHRDSLNLTGSRDTDHFNLHYMLFGQQVDSDLTGGRYDEIQAIASSTWRFGDDLSNSISIDGQHRQQTGDTQNENSNIGATSRLALTDDLDNRSGVSFGSSEFGGLADSTTDRGDFFTEFEHRLYDSLTTVLRADYLEQGTGPGDLQRIGGSARVQYRKQVPFGEVRASYRIGRFRQEEAGLFGTNVTVTDEPHVVTPGNPVILGNANVEQGNILVTDATGTIVYSTPNDYIVEQFGVLTRLVFPPGSRIVPGQLILVTYTYAPNFDRTFVEDSQAAGLELRFGDVLTAETHWSHSDQELVSGPPDDTLDTATEVGAGLHARLWSQNFSLDHLDRDSLLTPYTRTWVTWDTWLPVDSRFSINARVAGYRTYFKDERLEERGLSGGMDLRWNPDDNLSVEVQTELRRNELRTEDGSGVFVHGLLRYQFRKTTIDVSVIKSRELWDFSADRDVTRLFLTVTRRF